LIFGAVRPVSDHFLFLFLPLSPSLFLSFQAMSKRPQDITAEDLYEEMFADSLKHPKLSQEKETEKKEDAPPAQAARKEPSVMIDFRGSVSDHIFLIPKTTFDLCYRRLFKKALDPRDKTGALNEVLDLLDIDLFEEKGDDTPTAEDPSETPEMKEEKAKWESRVQRHKAFLEEYGQGDPFSDFRSAKVLKDISEIYFFRDG